MYCHCSAQAWIKKRWLLRIEYEVPERRMPQNCRSSLEPESLPGQTWLTRGHLALHVVEDFARMQDSVQDVATVTRPFNERRSLAGLCRSTKTWRDSNPSLLPRLGASFRFLGICVSWILKILYLQYLYLHLSLELPWTLKCSLCLLCAWPAKCAGSMAPKAPRTCPQSSWLPAHCRCSITASSSFISTCLGINAGSPIHNILILEIYIYIPEKGGTKVRQTRVVLAAIFTESRHKNCSVSPVLSTVISHGSSILTMNQDSSRSVVAQPDRHPLDN